MAWSQTTLDLVEAAITTAITDGFAELSMDGKSGRRYSLDELMKLRSVIKAAVDASAGTSRTTYAQHSRS